MGQSMINVFHMLVTATEPLSPLGGPPQRRLTLDSLVKRGLATRGDGDKTPVFTISDQGRTLAGLLWPGVTTSEPVKAARKVRTPRTANGRAAAKSSPAKAKTDA
jgi:hypothetical protein